MQMDNITLSEEEWEKIRLCLPISLSKEDITMIILSILLQYTINIDESSTILKNCIKNLPNVYEYDRNIIQHVQLIKNRMH
jgi:hypothetical protein